MKITDCEEYLQRVIPRQAVVLPYLIEQKIPGFYRYNAGSTAFTLSFSKEDCATQFDKFVNRVESAIGERYFPVVRFSDGEYLACVGHQKPYLSGLTLAQYLKGLGGYYRAKLMWDGSIKARTAPGVSSGDYNKNELTWAAERIPSALKDFSRNGLLALHMTFSSRPFQERYHAPFYKYLKNNEIILKSENYVHFYFVYAALRGEAVRRWFANRRILIVHSASGEKRKKIIDNLKKLGVCSIEWLPISHNKSLTQRIDVSAVTDQPDCIVVGAGIGKLLLIEQLKPLNVPIIDAGFCFEVWGDPEMVSSRPYMASDKSMSRLD